MEVEAAVDWVVGPPWWLVIVIFVLTVATTVWATRYQVLHSRKSARTRLFAEDARSDRTAVAELVRTARDFSTAARDMYESLNEMRASRLSEEEFRVRMAKSKDAKDKFRGVLDGARVRLGTTQLQTATNILDREATELVRKLGTYLDGTGFRLPLPGSTDLLFAGVDEAIDNLTNFAQIIRDDLGDVQEE